MTNYVLLSRPSSPPLPALALPFGIQRGRGGEGVRQREIEHEGKKETPKLNSKRKKRTRGGNGCEGQVSTFCAMICPGL